MFDVRTGDRLLDPHERADEAERQVRALKDELARLRTTAKKANGEKRKNGR
jgi:hypothetical protein